MGRKVTTTQLQIKGLKNAKVLATDARGFVFERDSEKGDKGEKGDTGIQGVQGDKGDTGAKGSDANSIDVQAGTNITIDKTNPLKPIINASGGPSGAGTDLGIENWGPDGYKITSSTGKGVMMPRYKEGGTLHDHALMPAKFYETGVFEPKLAVNGGDSRRYEQKVILANYTRIGNVVVFEFKIEIIKTNINVGNLHYLEISNLPLMTRQHDFKFDVRIASTNDVYGHKDDAEYFYARHAGTNQFQIHKYDGTSIDYPILKDVYVLGSGSFLVTGFDYK
ncbi:hypothetical protein [Tenacibaculum piscium]|uniref:hypothetical protein n=1 Tax=Tenacibaculum piscium TaxID=1458515 RepID=UPI001F336E50|nr:hypothetical protein [Tenacibaculum piscium]